MNHNSTDLQHFSTKDLNKFYKGRLVLKDFSIAVKNNEIIGLLGPNGAGKTTSFYIMVGLIRPDSGSITINNTIITNKSIHERARLGLSYLPQDSSIFQRLTVQENLQAVLELQVNHLGKSLTKSEIYPKIEYLLNALNISKIRNHRAYSLSGGQRRRVEIARTLATNPKFILLDEPFLGVDPIALIEIQKIILFLKNQGMGIVITDHNVRETLGICDRAYIINEGKVLTEGCPRALVKDKEVRRVYLGKNFRM